MATTIRIMVLDFMGAFLKVLWRVPSGETVVAAPTTHHSCGALLGVVHSGRRGQVHRPSSRILYFDRRSRRTSTFTSVTNISAVGIAPANPETGQPAARAEFAQAGSSLPS